MTSTSSVAWVTSVPNPSPTRSVPSCTPTSTASSRLSSTRSVADSGDPITTRAMKWSEASIALNGVTSIGADVTAPDPFFLIVLPPLRAPRPDLGERLGVVARHDGLPERPEREQAQLERLHAERDADDRDAQHEAGDRVKARSRAQDVERCPPSAC